MIKISHVNQLKRCTTQSAYNGTGISMYTQLTYASHSLKDQSQEYKETNNISLNIYFHTHPVGSYTYKLMTIYI